MCPFWEGETRLKLTLYVLFLIKKKLFFGGRCVRGIFVLSLYYFILFFFPVIETLYLQEVGGKSVWNMTYLYVFSILRRAEWLVLGHVKSYFQYRNWTFWFPAQVLSLLGRFARIGFIKFIVVTAL